MLKVLGQKFMQGGQKAIMTFEIFLRVGRNGSGGAPRKEKTDVTILGREASEEPLSVGFISDKDQPFFPQGPSQPEPTGAICSSHHLDRHDDLWGVKGLPAIYSGWGQVSSRVSTQ